jgi:hypothetical protein
LTLQEMFEVRLEVVGRRAAGFRMPASISTLLPGFPSETEIVDRAGAAPLIVTMPRGDDFAAAVSAGVSAKRGS